MALLKNDLGVAHQLRNYLKENLKEHYSLNHFPKKCVQFLIYEIKSLLFPTFMFFQLFKQNNNYGGCKQMNIIAQIKRY